MGIILEGISYSFPNTVFTNNEFACEFPTLDMQRHYRKTGIKQRYVSSAQETALDLAEQACNNLFEMCNIDTTSIDYIIFCTQSPDYALPPNAVQIQSRLNLSPFLGCFDYTHGCSGYVYGLSLASAIADAGQAKKILLITAETYTKFLSKQDHIARAIFGDAATATLLNVTDMPQGPSNFVFMTDGSGLSNLLVPLSGAKSQCVQEENLHEDSIKDGLRTKSHLYMNGPAIFEYTLKTVPALVNLVLSKARLDIASVDKFIFHQANTFILEHLRNKLHVPQEKFVVSMENCGNTVSNSIPIALKTALDEGMVKRGELVVFAGFGVGYSSAACTWRVS